MSTEPREQPDGSPCTFGQIKNLTDMSPFIRIIEIEAVSYQGRLKTQANLES